jgi:squalene-hopene/tetraprenyl-beta-curcumene cyclase
MNIRQIDKIIKVTSEFLLSKREEGKIWRGKLSSSAISTSVSVFALHEIDAQTYDRQIADGVAWLQRTMKADGSWGDSIESPSNLTATLLTYASLYAVGVRSEKTQVYLKERFGGETDEDIIQGVLDYYGTDLTFSVPILVMCALAGVISDWERIPPFPFELAVLPQRLFRFLNLPVVSYAIPALIAVGILRFKKGKQGLLAPLRRRFIEPSLKVLVKLQPADGGFLEAAPLTAFVSMCMAQAGYRNHVVTQKAAQFLVDTVREDGAWPIDTDLSGWVTSLSIRALDEDLPERDFFIENMKERSTKDVHPFTGAQPGGWGWSDLSGSVPDGDDTSGVLVAFHVLTRGTYAPEVGKGIEWLLDLQNNDGGMPTFCKGWGKLPFDRSSADISAHAFLAFSLWKEVLPPALKARTEKGAKRLLEWMETALSEEGSWMPLWFGDQDAADEKSPVYGTATAVDYLLSAGQSEALSLANKGLAYLLNVQNEDGGWGGAKGVASKVTLTAKVLGALASADKPNEVAMGRALDFLYEAYERGELFQREPIGLYFSRLWYSEELYSLTFLLIGLKKVSNYYKKRYE